MNTVRPNHAPSGDLRLTSALEEYRALLEAGERPDRDAFLTAHPDVGSELADCLAGLEFVCAAVPKLPSLSGSLAANVLDRLDEQATLGDFRIVREIGRGGMGIVYEAEQVSLSRRIALKVLPFAAMMDPRSLQRFRNEARAAASLYHEHIVPVYAVGCERGVHYYAMQYVEGFSLADLLDHLRSVDGLPSDKTDAHSPASAPDGVTEHFAGLGSPEQQKIGDDISASGISQADRSTLVGHPLAATLRDQRSQGRGQAYYRTVAEWGIQAAEALEHAHQMGIVHRDIKPGNLLISGGIVSDKGDASLSAKLWVTDFGLARTGADSGLTMTGDLLGTLRYMSPEQALGKHGLVDHRGDIYSLGATLYELLTLRPLVEGKDRQDILRKIAEEEPAAAGGAVPADLETIIIKTVEKDPGQRYPSARALAEDLRRFLTNQPIQAKRASLRQRIAKWGRRNRPLVAAAVAAAIVIAAVLGGTAGVWYQRRDARQRQVTREVNEVLDDVMAMRQSLAAKIADPVQVNPLLSRINDWKADLDNAGARLNQATALAAKDSDLVSDALSQRIKDATDGLADDRRDWQSAKELDDIRLAAGLVNGVWNPSAIGSRYEKFFQDLGIDVHTGPEAAKQIETSRLRYVLVAALDFWAMMSLDKDRTSSLLKIATLADPDPWRDRVRNPSTWSSAAAMKNLAARADFSRHSPHLAQLLAVRLKDVKVDPIPFLRAALSGHPNDFWLHLETAEAIPEWKDRIGAYHAALSVRPDSSPVHNNLAHVLRHVGDLEGAVLHFQRAIECDPLHIVSHIALADTLIQLKNIEGAKAELRVASDLAMRNASTLDPLGQAVSIHTGLGFGYHSCGDTGNAIAHLQKAITLAPESAGGYLRLARVHPDAKSKVEWYKAALSRDPGFVFAHQELADALHANGDHDGALAHWEEAFRLGFTSGETAQKLSSQYDRIGNAWRAKNDLDKARSYYRKARATYEKYPFPIDVGLKPPFMDRQELFGEVNVFLQAQQVVRSPLQLREMQRLAFGCLRGDLDESLIAVRSGKPIDVVQAVAAIRLWQSAPELANVREPSDLKMLEENDRLGWQKLWRDADQLLKEAAGRFKETELTRALTDQDRTHLHDVTLRAGVTYVLDLESTQFDALLRVTDKNGNTVAENNDIRAKVNPNSRIVYKPLTTLACRIVIAGADSGFDRIGAYTLTIREFVK